MSDDAGKETGATRRLVDAGVVHHRAGDLAAAERDYRAALALDPDQPDALHLLGQIGRAHV